MAKRKKLNKRVVMLLAVIGLIVVAGGVALVLYKSPKDPKVYARRGDEAFEKRDFRAAERAYLTAIGNSKDPVYYYKMAQLQLEWAEDQNLSITERNDRIGIAINTLQKALRSDHKFVDAQQLLCEIHWKWLGGGKSYIDEAGKLLALAGDDHEIYFRRALANARMAMVIPEKFTEDALADFQKAIELKNDEVSYWLGMAQFLQQIKRPKELQTVLADAITINPDHAVLRVAYAQHLHRQGQTDEALKQYQEAIEQEPDNALGNIALAGFYRAENKPDEVLKALQAAKAIDDSDFRIYRDLAITYSQQRQHDKAAAALREGLARIARRVETATGTEPEVNEQRRLKQSRETLTYFLANILLDTIGTDLEDKDKLLAEARVCLEQYALLAPDNPLKDKIAGRIAHVEGKIAEATELLERVYQRAAVLDLQTAYILANLYTQQNMPGKAEQVIDRLLKAPTPRKNIWALLAKARLEMRYRDYTKAARYVAQAIQVDPDNTEARNLKLALDVISTDTVLLPAGLKFSDEAVKLILDHASTMRLGDKRDQATELLEQLHQRIPENLLVTSRLANMYIEQGQPDKAKTLLEQLKAAYSQDPEMQTKLQQLLEVLEETDPQEQFKKRLAMAEENPNPIRKALEKAAVCAAFRRFDEYTKYLQEAVDIDPSAAEAASANRQLQMYAQTQKDWELAQQCVQRATEHNLDGCGGQLAAAELAMVREQYSSAIDLLEKVLADHPGSKLASIMLGEAYFRTKNTERAEEIFLALASSDPSYVPALVGMARLTEQQGKWPEHAEWIERAYRLAPHQRYVQGRYIDLQEERRKPEEIIPQRERILRSNPGDLQNCLRLAVLYERTKQLAKAEQMYRFIAQNASEKLLGASILARFYTRTNRTSESDKIVTKLIADAKANNDKSLLVGAYVLWGELLSTYDPARAQEVFQKAIGTDSNDPRGHLAMARLLGAQRNWRAAANAMERFLVLRPEALASRKELIRFHIEGGQFILAGELLDNILAADPSDVEALSLKGYLAMRQGKGEKAKEILDRALQINPNYPPALVYRSELFLQQGEPIKAKNYLHSAMRSSKSPEIAMQLGEIHLLLNDPDNAELVYRNLLESREDYAPAILKLIDLYLQHRKWELLEPLLVQARKRFPENPTYLLVEADMWTRRENLPRAIMTLEAAARMAPQSTTVLRAYLLSLLDAKEYQEAVVIAHSHMDKPYGGPWVKAVCAAALAKQNDTDRADELFASALKEAPTQQLGLIVRQVNFAYGLKVAVEKLNKWIPDNRPGDWQAYMAVGDLLRGANDSSEALRTYLKARDLAKSPKNRALVDQLLGPIYYQMDKTDKAEETYLAILQVYPNDIGALNNLAYAYVDKLNQPDKALPYAEKVLKQLPHNASVLDTYGWVLAKLGRYAEAEQYLSRSLRLRRPPADGWYHLGWVYEQTGRPKDAMTQYRLGFETIRDDKDHLLYQTLSEAIKRVERQMVNRSGP